MSYRYFTEIAARDQDNLLVQAAGPHVPSQLGAVEAIRPIGPHAEPLQQNHSQAKLGHIVKMYGHGCGYCYVYD